MADQITVTCAVTITARPSTTDDTTTASTSFSLDLVQEDYDYAAPGDFADWVVERGYTVTAANVYQLQEEYQSACNEDGELIATLRVYLSDLTTPYNLVASYGTLSPAELVQVTETERVELDIDDQASIEFGTITAASFEGDVLDETGVVTGAPDITFAGQSVTLGAAVDATLVLTKQVDYYRHTLTIQPRDVAEDMDPESADFDLASLYAATVKCYAGGKKRSLEVAMPDNFGSCSDDFISSGGGTGDGSGDDTEYVVTYEAFDICTGEPIPDAEFVVDGVALTDPAAGQVLSAGQHTIVATATGYAATNTDDIDENDSFTLSGS